ncbi:MAG: TIGR00282 family metallophosphoesterase [Oscillospiraceae bacterium]|nr:TIGR00282 family metallophosphoesterase [Oscillospiraceae bacterium]
MRIVFIGDVVGQTGCNAIIGELPKIRREYGADLTIVNGENSDDNNGLSRRSAQAIMSGGADIITTGNHAFKRKSILEEYENNERIIRPANYGDTAAGRGFCEIDCGAYSVAVINLVGTAFMQPADNPFKCVDELLKRIRSKIIVVDFHAEATSEKCAMSWYLAGRVSAVIGTHTHVQTADERIIDGTGCISDAGMTGPINSVLGVRKEIIIEKFADYIQRPHVFADGECRISGVCLEIDRKSGKCTSIERIYRTVS